MHLGTISWLGGGGVVTSTKKSSHPSKDDAGCCSSSADKQKGKKKLSSHQIIKITPFSSDFTIPGGAFTGGAAPSTPAPRGLHILQRWYSNWAQDSEDYLKFIFSHSVHYILCDFNTFSPFWHTNPFFRMCLIKSTLKAYLCPSIINKRRILVIGDKLEW